MSEVLKNYAFVDQRSFEEPSGKRALELDWTHFRTYLREKHQVKKAYLFLDYQAEETDRYSALKAAGYDLMFKQSSINAEIVLQVMMDYRNYQSAVVVTAAGDLFSVIKYLLEHDKLERLIIPDKDHYSPMLRQAPLSGDTTTYLNNVIESFSAKEKALKIQV